MEKEQIDKEFLNVEKLTSETDLIAKDVETEDNKEIIEDKKETASENEQTEQNNVPKYFFAVILLIILILGGLAYYNKYYLPNRVENFQGITGNDIKGLVEESYFYKNTEFMLIDGLWYFTLYNQNTKKYYNIPLHYGPKEAIDVPITGKLNDPFINEGKVYLTFNPGEQASEELAYVTLASIELSLNLKQSFGTDIISSCTENVSSCLGKPIITCDNTNEPVIFLKYVEEDPKVEFKQNCVVLSGKEKDLTKSVDRFLLLLYGIFDY